MTAGRFAPSPSGDLHLGNLRTALLAWLFARSTGAQFKIRMEDLDRVQPGAQERQLADLESIGLTWQGPVVRQSDRRDLYLAAVDRLQADDLVYPCYCTRREILQAPSAPHVPPGAYPGTCRQLSSAQRATRQQTRPAALRLRSMVDSWTVTDSLHGEFVGTVDDLVLLRGDGVPAYNLAVVVDDAEQGITQVVRADDLLSSTPRQAYLASLLGYPQATYAHVPLVLGPSRTRLAKRDGAVTASQLRERGLDPVELILDSLSLSGPLDELVSSFDPTAIPRSPWVFIPPD